MIAYFLLVILAAATRLAPHPENFAPIAALALLAGATGLQQTSKAGRIAVLGLPLLAMLVSDYMIGFYTWQVMATVYFGFALTAGLGLLVRRRYSWGTIFGASLAGSIIFFLLTNAAVWAFTPMYEKTFLGLMESYYNALPFFRNSLFGDLVYTAVLFGIYELAVTPGAISLRRQVATAN